MLSAVAEPNDIEQIYNTIGKNHSDLNAYLKKCNIKTFKDAKAVAKKGNNHLYLGALYLYRDLECVGEFEKRRRKRNQ